MQEIMVWPRECFHGLDGFVLWPHASNLIDSAIECVSWMPRPEAESSEQWVQPIPCVIFRDSRGQYCVFRQARQLRSDLSHRVSFIVGGHIDSGWGNKNIRDVFEETAKWEVLEEVGVHLDRRLKPVGMVVDSSSLLASRHIGFVYEAIVDQKIKSLVTEEFNRLQIQR